VRQEKQTHFGAFSRLPQVDSDGCIWNCASIHLQLVLNESAVYSQLDVRRSSSYGCRSSCLITDQFQSAIATWFSNDHISYSRLILHRITAELFIHEWNPRQRDSRQRNPVIDDNLAVRSCTPCTFAAWLKTT